MSVITYLSAYFFSFFSFIKFFDKAYFTLAKEAVLAY